MLTLRMKIDFLIRVRDYPVLYDPRYPEYKNTRGPEKNATYRHIWGLMFPRYPGQRRNLTVASLKRFWTTTKNVFRTRVQNGTQNQYMFNHLLRWYQPYINFIILHPLEAQDVILGLQGHLNTYQQRQAVLIAENERMRQTIQANEERLREMEFNRQRVAQNIMRELLR